MKALHIYPHAIDRGHDCIIDSEGTMRVHRELDDFASAKRFTDAELAAEHYRAAFYHESEVADNDGYDGSVAARAYYRQSRAFYRFATSPHFDEVAS